MKCHEGLIYLISSARNFSLLIGVFYAGGAIDPVLGPGGFLNERTGDLISALYAATVLHLAYPIVACVALPESITQDAMVHARYRYADELATTGDPDVGPFRRVLVLVLRFISIERARTKTITKLSMEEELELNMVGWFGRADKCYPGMYTRYFAARV